MIRGQCQACLLYTSIGLYRDEETLQPVEYFGKLPKDSAERDVLVLDPMPVSYTHLRSMSLQPMPQSLRQLSMRGIRVSLWVMPASR